MYTIPGVRVNDAAKHEKLISVYAIRKKLEINKAIMLRSPNREAITTYQHELRVCTCTTDL